MKKKWMNVITLVFLGMMVVGFSIPAFLDDESQQVASNPADRKLCQSDSDCYLICNSQPTGVLCSQNMCLHDSCEEEIYYELIPTPVTFSLNVEVNNESVNLIGRTNQQDVFVKFSGENVYMFASGLSLHHVLEKADMVLNSQCLTVDEEYCNSEFKSIQFLVNGNESFLYENYVPGEGDSVDISYS